MKYPGNEFVAGVGFGCMTSVVIVVLTGLLFKVLFDLMLAGKF